ncbi:uncharacterized protein LOC142322994 [Lycorma delicatula]|uniref:uncharacterized protein LOC142322994 n=1 Tax=Lycorma delicatula TaxID=130591 RepID=UPI003F51722C
MLKCCLLVLLVLVALSHSRPQDEAPMPYQYEYKVEDQEKQLYHGKEESGNEAGKVEGKYYVLLPDNRLMTVTYSVEGESGFIQKTEYQDNAQVFG